MAEQIPYPTWSDYSFGFVPGTELPAGAVFEHMAQAFAGELDVVLTEESLRTDDYPDGITVLNVRIGRHPFYLQFEALDDDADEDEEFSEAGALIDLYARPDASPAELWFLDQVGLSVRVSFDLGAWGESALSFEDDAEISDAATRIAAALDTVPGLFEFEGRRTEEERQTLHLPAGAELPHPPADWTSPVEYSIGRGAWIPASADADEETAAAAGLPTNLEAGLADALLADAGYDVDGDPAVETPAERVTETTEESDPPETNR